MRRYAVSLLLLSSAAIAGCSSDRTADDGAPRSRSLTSGATAAPGRRRPPTTPPRRSPPTIRAPRPAGCGTLDEGQGRLLHAHHREEHLRRVRPEELRGQADHARRRPPRLRRQRDELRDVGREPVRHVARRRSTSASRSAAATASAGTPTRTPTRSSPRSRTSRSASTSTSRRSCSPGTPRAAMLAYKLGLTQSAKFAGILIENSGPRRAAAVGRDLEDQRRAHRPHGRPVVPDRAGSRRLGQARGGRDPAPEERGRGRPRRHERRLDATSCSRRSPTWKAP